MRILLIPVLLLLTAACAATGSVQKVPMPDPASASDPAKARVFLFRDDQTFGVAWNLLVSSASRELGEIGPEAYLCFELPPGLAQFRLVLDRARLAGPPITAAIPHRLEAGKTYYGVVNFEKEGARLEIELTFLSDAEGRERLTGLTPAVVAP